MTTKHRRREVIHTTGNAVEAPSPPPGLSAARRRAWVLYRRSEAGIAAFNTGDQESALTLWWLYRELDRVSKLLREAPARTVGSMGQARVNPLASRHMELSREVRAREKALAIGGPLNRQRLPDVEVDPAFALARIQTVIPSLDFDEFGGFRYGYGEKTEEDIEALAASRLRDGKPVPGEPDIHNNQLPGLIEAHGIDARKLRVRAEARNRENAALLLAEWERMLAEAQRQLPWADPGMPETRLRALISLLEEHLNDAAERGVIWAQSAPLAQGRVGERRVGNVKALSGYGYSYDQEAELRGRGRWAMR